MSIKVIRNFPDINDIRYNYRNWNKQFEEQNVILNGKFSHLYYPSHWTSLSIKFAFGGSEQYILGNMKYSVSNQKYLILNRDTIYESLIDSHETVESLTLNFTAQFTEEVFSSCFNNEEYLTDYPEIRDKYPVNFFEQLYLFDNELEIYITLIKNELNKTCSAIRLNELMHYILEHTFRKQLNLSITADDINSVKRSTRLELFNRLHRAKDYIHSNFYDDISLEVLSKVSMICPHHFLRRFKSFFGVTPYQYLKNLRMENACKFLLNTDKSITEICIACGYDSLSSFSYLFRSTYNKSPEEYRKVNSKKSIFKQ